MLGLEELKDVWRTTYATEFCRNNNADDAIAVADLAVTSIIEVFGYKPCGLCKEFTRDSRYTGKCDHWQAQHGRYIAMGYHSPEPIHIFGTCDRYNYSKVEPKEWLTDYHPIVGEG